MSSSRKGSRSGRLSRHDRPDRPPTREDSHQDLQHRAARARGMSDAIMGNWVQTTHGAPNKQGTGAGSNGHGPSRNSESEGFASRQNSSTDLSVGVNPNMVQVNTGLLKAPEEDPMLRGRSDSDTRGRSLSNSVLSPLKVHITREGSATPTRVSSSNEDQSIPLANVPMSDPPRSAFPRQSSLNPITYDSFQHRMNFPTPARALDASRMGFGRGTRQHPPPSEEVSSTATSTRLAIDNSPNSSVPPTSFPAGPTLTSATSSPQVSRKRSTDVPVNSSTSALRQIAKSSRRRSLSDTGPLRPNTADAVQSTSSLTTSVETTQGKLLYDSGDTDDVPISNKNSLPRKALKILGDDNYDPSSDIYISDPRSDMRKTPTRPATADSSQVLSPEKTKKVAWRSRLLPISTSSDGKKGFKAIEDKVATKTRLNLWGTGPAAAKMAPHPDDDLGGMTAEKLINAHLL